MLTSSGRSNQKPRRRGNCGAQKLNPSAHKILRAPELQALICTRVSPIRQI